MKSAYWARFFKKPEGGYLVDIPDLPGCLTSGKNVEQAYQVLINQAIPLWLEDQTWPDARTADEIMSVPGREGQAPALLVRVSIDEVGGPTVGTWSIRSIDLDYAKRRMVN
ncbi:type II toxin-antitoxin system HicB family antitoxin [Deltaproteobacteria bacterium OttesenSCG-928-K17]|nr:type II toxin-antitoxin system HicB family antitoxin [Deltaproteobacteria bacterium OttesenSCG-928-K17]